MLSVAHSNSFDTQRSLLCLKSWLLANPDYQGTLDMEPLEEYDELYGGQDAQRVGAPFNADLHKLVTKIFLEASKLNPNDAGVWTALGLLYRLSSDFDLSIAAFKTALTLKPEDAQMWNMLGAMATNAGHNQEVRCNIHNALEWMKHMSWRCSCMFGLEDSHMKTCMSVVC